MMCIPQTGEVVSHTIIRTVAAGSRFGPHELRPHELREYSIIYSLKFNTYSYLCIMDI